MDDSSAAKNTKETGAQDVIEFVSPGTFSIHNPETRRNDTPVARQAEQSTVSHRLHEATAFSHHSLQLIQQARRHICIYSTDLEPWLYGTAEMFQACKTFLLAHSQNHLQVLLQDSTRIARDGHPLLPLIERLSSRASIRTVHPEHEWFEGCWLSTDQPALLIRHTADSYAGHVFYCDRARHWQQQLKFEAMWSVALPDINLRRMPL